jgi:hypothetical protein
MRQAESVLSTRRAVLTGLAAAVPTAAIAAPALAAEPDAEIDALWRERTALCTEGARVHALWREAHAKLPWWAAPGPEHIDHQGKPHGYHCGWPAMQDVKPAPYPGTFRRIRVSGYDIRADYRQAVERLTHPAQRARVRARYHERMRKFIALRRAQKAEEDKLGVRALSEAIDAISERINDIGERIREERSASPTAVAARLLLTLAEEAEPKEPLADQEWAALNIAATLRLIEPQTTGVVREHIAAIHADPDRPLSAVPIFPV